LEWSLSMFFWHNDKSGCSYLCLWFIFCFDKIINHCYSVSQQKFDISKIPLNLPLEKGDFLRFPFLKGNFLFSSRFLYSLIEIFRFAQNDIYVPKWHLCAKMTFMCQNDIYVLKWYLCAKMIFMCQNDIYVPKWYL